MIKRIDWYIIRSFLGAFSLALGLFTVIIIIFDVSEKIDDFVEKSIPFKTILTGYYLNFVPFLLNQFSPIFIFISVIFFTSRLANRSEIIAILSSGVSYPRFLRPYMITAAFLGVLSFVLNAWIIPSADKVRVDFENTYIRDISNDYRENIKRQIQPGIVMSLQSFNYLDSFGYLLNLEHIENNRLVSRLSAEKMQWNREAGKWGLSNYKYRKYHKDGTQSIEFGKQLDTTIQFNPLDFFRRVEDVQSFNLQELNEYIELERMRGTENVFFYQTEKFRRYAAPFSILVLTFIAVCVSSIKTRQGIGLHLGKGLLISFFYLFVIQFFNSYGSSGSMHPLLAVSLPNVLFFGIGLYFYRNTQK